jgi:arylsulfatase A-like enzyme
MFKRMRPTRRQWLAGMPAAAVASAQQREQGGRAARPNIILIISDQFRSDLIGAIGVNPMNLTPNLDQMAARGVLFRSAFVNQPVCAPARASIFTGQYPCRHGVWRNAAGPLRPDTATLASSLRDAGYSANFIGKWHLGVNEPNVPREQHGPVKPAERGGFLNLWEASNELEWTSHAYEGSLYDADGQPLHFSGIYRTDFMTQRAQRFLRSGSAESPFFLTLSYLELHHQNDSDTYDPPKEYKGRYPNPFIPGDLRTLPGSWPSQLADYYACAAKMDETVGTIRKALAETGLDKNTILIFTSDHSCHFKTRNSEYKRSPHDSSIHIPLIVEGPGFNRSLEISELVSQVDLMPSMLESAGVRVPASVQGRSFLPLLDRRTEGWRNEVFFQMSEFVTGRGLRTPQYTYAVMAPKMPGWRAAPAAEKYVEYMLYDNYADPFQHVNLAGRTPYQSVAADLRKRMLARMAEAGDVKAVIEPCWMPYS